MLSAKQLRSTDTALARQMIHGRPRSSYPSVRWTAGLDINMREEGIMAAISPFLFLYYVS